MNGHTIGFRREIQKLELHYMSPLFTLRMEGLKHYGTFCQHGKTILYFLKMRMDWVMKVFESLDPMSLHEILTSSLEVPSFLCYFADSSLEMHHPALLRRVKLKSKKKIKHEKMSLHRSSRFRCSSRVCGDAKQKPVGMLDCYTKKDAIIQS